MLEVIEDQIIGAALLVFIVFTLAPIDSFHRELSGGAKIFQIAYLLRTPQLITVDPNLVFDYFQTELSL